MRSCNCGETLSVSVQRNAAEVATATTARKTVLRFIGRELLSYSRNWQHFFAGLKHQVAAVDVEGRAGDVAGGLGGSEANQIGDFERGAEARHGIVRGETFERL